LSISICGFSAESTIVFCSRFWRQQAFLALLRAAMRSWEHEGMQDCITPGKVFLLWTASGCHANISRFFRL
jgi:hypothetical protein